MLQKRMLRAERKEEMNLFAVSFVNLADMKLDRLVTDDHLVLNREFPKLCDKLRGLYRVNDKDPEKHSDKEGERKILRQPFQTVQNMRVDNNTRRRSMPRKTRISGR